MRAPRMGALGAVLLCLLGWAWPADAAKVALEGSGAGWELPNGHALIEIGFSSLAPGEGF